MGDVDEGPAVASIAIPAPSRRIEPGRPAERVSETTLRLLTSREDERERVDAERAERARHESALRRAAEDLLFAFRSSHAAVGFGAQAYDSCGGGAPYYGGDAEDPERGGALAVWDLRAPSVRDHLRRLSQWHRLGVRRAGRIADDARARWRTFSLAFDPSATHALLSTCADDGVRARMRDAFVWRGAAPADAPPWGVHEEPVVDDQGRGLYTWRSKQCAGATRVAARSPQPEGEWERTTPVVTTSTKVSLAALALDTRELALAYARDKEARINAPPWERVEYLAAAVDESLARKPKPSALVRAVRAAAEGRLRAALDAYVAGRAS